MKETIFVKPKAGFKIRRPDTNALLSEDGENVPKNTFWARRLLDGDVIESKEEKKQEQKQEDAPAMQAEADSQPEVQEAPAKSKGGRK